MDRDKQSELILAGGPNGAGKTTFVESFLRGEGRTYLGADQIAYEMRPDDVASVAVAAGREFIRRLQVCRQRGENLIVESTLSGKSLSGHLRIFRESGYAVKIVFISLPAVADSIARVALRVSKGGHDVPREDLERRFLRTHHNFWHVYRPLADRWYLYLNNRRKHEKVAEGIQDSYVVENDSLMQAFLWKAQS